MIYPVYVHLGDAEHAHGATIPDFPGCFSAADDWQDLPAKIQEAIEVYCEGEALEIPAPTPEGLGVCEVIAAVTPALVTTWLSTAEVLGALFASPE